LTGEAAVLPCPAGRRLGRSRFAKHEKATNAKYLEKTLTIEGNVVRIDEGALDRSVSIILAGHEVDDKKPLRLVCYLTGEQAQQVKYLFSACCSS
jgi:hypothetical protein